MVKETNYTKGEWKVDSVGSELVSVICPSRAEVIAICGKAKWITSRDTQLANANLIASAPQLYEALKKAMRIIEVEHLSVPYYCREAIAKAEGK